MVERNQRNFQAVAGVTQVTAVIDCTHIEVRVPSKDRERVYINRKGFKSLNVQVVVDSFGNFVNVSAIFPGSVHDSYIMQHSCIYRGFDSGECTGTILADSGYSGRLPWIQAPIPFPHSQGEVE